LAQRCTLKMTKPRGVQFKHRGSPTESRRPSELSEGMDSKPDSSTNGDLSKSQVILEEETPSEPGEPSEYSKKKQSFITRYELVSS
jgi:hypothetical protein